MILNAFLGSRKGIWEMKFLPVDRSHIGVMNKQLEGLHKQLGNLQQHPSNDIVADTKQAEYVNRKIGDTIGMIRQAEWHANELENKYRIEDNMREMQAQRIWRELEAQREWEAQQKLDAQKFNEVRFQNIHDKEVPYKK